MPSGSRIVEEHRSSDGLLRFLVDRSDDGDVTLGFDGYAWHTHADLLASDYGLSEDATVRQFVDALLTNRIVIATARVGGVIQDVWVTDSPEDENKYKVEGETIEFRFWGGRLAS